eukprot:Rhum_TRINITY_DN14433_c14_g1::Rhum_TRINITY_DN14433_c14_g1_i1::g.91274::m.91274
MLVLLRHRRRGPRRTAAGVRGRQNVNSGVRRRLPAVPVATLLVNVLRLGEHRNLGHSVLEMRGVVVHRHGSGGRGRGGGDGHRRLNVAGTEGDVGVRSGRGREGGREDNRLRLLGELLRHARVLRLRHVRRLEQDVLRRGLQGGSGGGGSGGGGRRNGGGNRGLDDLRLLLHLRRLDDRLRRGRGGPLVRSGLLDLRLDDRLGGGGSRLHGRGRGLGLLHNRGDLGDGLRLRLGHLLLDLRGGSGLLRGRLRHLLRRAGKVGPRTHGADGLALRHRAGGEVHNLVRLLLLDLLLHSLLLLGRAVATVTLAVTLAALLSALSPLLAGLGALAVAPVPRGLVRNHVDSHCGRLRINVQTGGRNEVQIL